jgi:YD repeat-containing protein
MQSTSKSHRRPFLAALPSKATQSLAQQPARALATGPWRRLVSVGLLAALALADGRAYATEGGSQDPPEQGEQGQGNPFEGMDLGADPMGSFPSTDDVDLFHGSYVPRIGFELLASSAGPTPELGLVYSAGRSNGLLGAGWDFDAFSSITRRSSTGGLPVFQDEASDPTTEEADRFYVGSSMLIAQADGSYRAATDAFTIYAPIRASAAFGDGITRQRIVGWRVQGGGRTLEYGAVGAEATGLCQDGVEYGIQRDTAQSAPCELPLRWLLTATEDAQGNRLTIEYASPTYVPYSALTTPLESSHILVPARMRYGVEAEAGGAGGVHEVLIGYEGRADLRADTSDGLQRVVASRVASVEVATWASGQRATVRKYGLDYVQGADGQSLLSEVKLLAVDASGEPTSAPEITVRKMRYEAPANAALSFGAWQSIDVIGEVWPSGWPTPQEALLSGAEHLYTSETELRDVDEDGLVDLIVRNQRTPITLEAESDLATPASPLHRHWVLLHAERDTSGALAWVERQPSTLGLSDNVLDELEPRVAGTLAGATELASELDLTAFGRDFQLADLNADGLLDVVTADRVYLAPFDPARYELLSFYDESGDLLASAGQTVDLPAAEDYSAGQLAAGCATQTSNAAYLLSQVAEHTVPSAGASWQTATAAVFRSTMGASPVDAEQWLTMHSRYVDINGDGMTDRVVAAAIPQRVSLAGFSIPTSTSLLSQPVWIGPGHALWQGGTDACGMLSAVYLGLGNGRFERVQYGVGGDSSWPGGPSARVADATTVELNAPAVAGRHLLPYLYRQDETSNAWSQSALSALLPHVRTEPVTHLSWVDAGGLGRAQLVQAFGTSGSLYAALDMGLWGTAAGAPLGYRLPTGSGNGMPGLGQSTLLELPVERLGRDAEGTVTALTDWDGDGQVDVLRGPNVRNGLGALGAAWRDNARTQSRGHLLRELEGTFGGITEVEWTHAGALGLDTAGLNPAVVTRISDASGERSYSYAQPVVDVGDRSQRQWHGFGSVSALGTSGLKRSFRFESAEAVRGQLVMAMTSWADGTLHSAEITHRRPEPTGTLAFELDTEKPYFNPPRRSCAFEFSRPSVYSADNEFSLGELWDLCREHDEAAAAASVPNGGRMSVTESTWTEPEDGYLALLQERRDADVAAAGDETIERRYYHSFDAQLGTAMVFATAESMAPSATVSGIEEPYKITVYPAYEGSLPTMAAGMSTADAAVLGAVEMAHQQGNPGPLMAFDAAVSMLEYDSLGRLVATQTAEEGQASNQTEYGPCGVEVTAVVRPDGPALVSTYTYGSRCEIVSSSGPSGVVQTVNYDSHGRAVLVQQTVPASRESEASSNWVRYAYDAGAQATGEAASVATVMWDSQATGGGAELLSKVYVDGYGRTWRTTQCRREPTQEGSYPILAATGAGQLDNQYACAEDDAEAGEYATHQVTLRLASNGHPFFSTQAFDARDGGVMLASAPSPGFPETVPLAVGWNGPGAGTAGGGEIPGAMSMDDALGRPLMMQRGRDTQMWQYALLTPAGSHTIRETSVMGGAVGSRILETERWKMQWLVAQDGSLRLLGTSESDASGRTLRVKDGAGQTTDFAYDGFGRANSVTAPEAGVSSCEQDSGYSIVKTDARARASVQYEYNQYGRMLASEDATGQRTLYTYDSLGRLLERIGPSNTIVEAYSYHGDAGTDFDRRIQSTDIDGNVSTQYFDALGRAVVSEDISGVQVIVRYDSLGRVVSKLLPWAERQSTGYNALGQPHRVGSAQLGSAGAVLTESWTTTQQTARGQVYQTGGTRARAARLRRAR